MLRMKLSCKSWERAWRRMESTHGGQIQKHQKHITGHKGTRLFAFQHARRHCRSRCCHPEHSHSLSRSSVSDLANHMPTVT